MKRIPLPPAYPHSGEGISLRHWLLPHLRGKYHSLLPILTRGGNITQTLLPHLRGKFHSLLPILTRGGNIHSNTGCCLTSGDNTTPSCLSSLGVGISLRHWLLSHLRGNTTPSCLSSLGEGISLRHRLLSHLRGKYHSLLPIVNGGGNITQTLAAVSPQETIPLPPVYRHWGREYHSDTGCCLTSVENTTPSCLSSLGEGISLRHWLLSHLRRQYHSLLSIVTGGGNITQTQAAASPQETIPLPPVYRHWGREYHSDTGCCLTSGDNTTPSCLSSLGEGISLRHRLLPHLRREYNSLLPIVNGGGNITQTQAAASPKE